MANTYIRVEPETHARFLAVAKSAGFKVGAMADRIIRNWLDAPVFCLPRSLPNGNASRKRPAESAGCERNRTRGRSLRAGGEKTGPAVRAVKCGPAAEQGAPAALPGKAPETSEREWSATAAGVQAAGGVRSAAESAGSTGAPPVPSSRALAGAATATRPAGVGANGAAGRRMTDEG
jgi:hypothetical protein